MTRIYITLVLMMLVLSGYSQELLLPNTDTLVWKVDQLKYESLENVVVAESEIITYGNQRVKWAQSATRVYDFTVTSAEGTWDTIENIGSVKWLVISKSLNGVITLSRDAETITVEFKVRKNEDAYNTIICKIKEVHKLN